MESATGEIGSVGGEEAEPTAERASLPALPARTRFFYALGQAAEGIKNESFGLFLLFYYTGHREFRLRFGSPSE